MKQLSWLFAIALTAFTLPPGNKATIKGSLQLNQPVDMVFLTYRNH